MVEGNSEAARLAKESDEMSAAVPWYLKNPKDATELILVPGGWFWMGSADDDSDADNDEKPRHLDYVAPFYISLACITVEQFG